MITYEDERPACPRGRTDCPDDGGEFCSESCRECYRDLCAAAEVRDGLLAERFDSEE